MTARLSKALQQLREEDIQVVEAFAEFLASRQPAKAEPPKHLPMGWVGSASELAREYASGVDAAHAATDMIVESLERKLKR